MPDRKTIVIVEDDFIIAEDLRGTCEEFGARVLAVTHNAEDAIKAIQTHKPQYVLMDVRLDGRRDGVEVALAVYQEGSDTKVIYITGSNEPPAIARINADHPHRILIKPIRTEELREALGLLS